MQRNLHVRTLSSLFALGLIAGTALGAEPQSADKPTLSGPKVQTPQTKDSLVERNFEGEMKQLQIRPEVAAIEKLDLSDDEKQGVERVMQKRAALVERALYDNMALFLEVQGLRQSGAVGPNASGDESTRRKGREKMLEMQEKVQPLLHPRLSDTLASELTPEHREQFLAMLKEHAEESAATNERDASSQPRRAAGGPRSAERVELGNTLREMARALSSIVEERRGRTEELLRTVQATPEQEEKIRAAVRDVGSVADGPNASPERRAEIMRKVMEILTPEQRQALIASRRGQAK